MADPYSVNEMTILAKNPPPNVIRQSNKFNVLTHKGVGRKASLLVGKHYSQINLIVAKLDRQISISAHQKGRIVDATETFSLLTPIGSANGTLIDDKLLTKDSKIELAFESLAYYIAKDIGSLAASLSGDIDGIAITGEIVKSEFMMRWISERIGYLGNIFLFPNENEMDFLAESVLRVLDGEENVQEYK
jgi:butyrate kinase